VLLGEDLKERIRLIEKLEETLKGYHLEQEFQIMGVVLCACELHDMCMVLCHGFLN